MSRLEQWRFYRLDFREISSKVAGSFLTPLRLPFLLGFGGILKNEAYSWADTFALFLFYYQKSYCTSGIKFFANSSANIFSTGLTACLTAPCGDLLYDSRYSEFRYDGK